MRLPDPFHWTSWRATIADFALVSYAVPAAKLRALLPRSESISLDTMRVENELEECGIISTGCFSNVDMKPALVPGPGIDFDQVTYRTYVHFRGRPATYFFGTTLSRPAPLLLERSLVQVASMGRFHSQKDFSPSEGYRHYVSDVRCRRHGDLYLKLEATGTPTSNRLVDSLTYRLHGLFPSHLGITFDQYVRHRHMLPWTGRLIRAEFQFWERLGLLSREEAQNPLSVLVTPSVDFRFYPPFPAIVATALLPGRFAVQEHRLQP